MTTPAPLNVLVVGINYAPEHAGIGPYTSAAAEHLASLGHDVTVLTGLPHYPSWTVPAAYRRGLRTTEILAGVTVHRLRHFVPRSQDVLRRTFYELTFAAHVLFRGWSMRPDVVIAVVPSLFSAQAAAWIARRRRARFITWIQDSMSAAATQSGMSGGKYVSNAIAALEGHLLRTAEWVAIVSDAFRGATDLAGIEATRVLTIHNWIHISPATDTREATRAKQGWLDGDTIVLHSGNMGLKQDLTTVVDAARLASKNHPEVRFILMGAGSQLENIAQSAADVTNIDIIPPVSENDYSAMLIAADVLLINERPGVVDMSLPSKLTSYLTSGRPVLAAVDKAGGTASEVFLSGGGMVTDAQTSAAILTGVREIMSNPTAADIMGRQGRIYAESQLSANRSLDRLVTIVETQYTHMAAAGLVARC